MRPDRQRARTNPRSALGASCNFAAPPVEPPFGAWTPESSELRTAPAAEVVLDSKLVEIEGRKDPQT